MSRRERPAQEVLFFGFQIQIAANGLKTESYSSDGCDVSVHAFLGSREPREVTLLSCGLGVRVGAAERTVFSSTDDWTDVLKGLLLGVLQNRLAINTSATS